MTLHPTNAAEFLEFPAASSQRLETGAGAPPPVPAPAPIRPTHSRTGQNWSAGPWKYPKVQRAKKRDHFRRVILNVIGWSVAPFICAGFFLAVDWWDRFGDEYRASRADPMVSEGFTPHP